MSRRNGIDRNAIYQAVTREAQKDLGNEGSITLKLLRYAFIGVFAALLCVIGLPFAIVLDSVHLVYMAYKFIARRIGRG
jgi:hypothetical protein